MGKENIADIYELSPLQQGMLFHTLKEPQAGLYVVQLGLTMRGRLELAMFEQAWQRVMERHPIFRTAFYWEQVDKPLQVVYRQVALPLQVLDWRGLPPSVQETQLNDLLLEDRRRGFQVSQAPLMRLILIRTAPDVHTLLWSHHHLLMDGWSLSLVLQEVFTFYEALRQGGQVQLDAARPFKDYITWLHQQDLSRAQAFWRQYLDGFAAPTRLAVDHDKEATAQSSGPCAEIQALSLPETMAALQTLARQHQLTLNTILLGVWALVLGRYSGQDDIVFGSVVSGRPPTLAGVESIVGPFINTLPVRARLNRADYILDWLKTLQEQQLEMRQYEYSPLVEVQGWSQIPRGQPLFEHAFVFENYPVSASVQDQRLSLELTDVRHIEQTNFPLGLIVWTGPRLSLKMSFNAARYEPATVERMLAYYQTLLASIVAEPGQRILDLPPLTEAERRQILVDWNDTCATTPRACVHKLFEEQVERAPDAPALVLGQERLSYAQLNQRANRLAHYLQASGVGPETLVGICMERSVEMIVAVLGTLKAGGAYVPLDPAYPHERLSFMLADSRSPVLLTQARLLDRLPAHQARTICLDRDWPQIEQCSAENPVSDVSIDNLAYVIYTSGSTGRPKGVMITHEGLGSLAHDHQQRFNIHAASRVLQFASLSFDGSVAEIWDALLAGATLYLATTENLRPGEPLLGLLRQAAITTLTLPPSAWAALPPADLPALETAVSAGEACTPAVVARWAPGRRFINGYGPTEVTVCATCAELTADQSIAPIGRPIANKRVYVLDAHGQPTPPGVPGELYIGGLGLARGYLNRPDLTAERFVPDPFSDQPGARMYRTGDLVRYLPDGNLEFLGRVDHQVKVRGFRIELEEIEAALNRHPQVQQAAVIARQMEPSAGQDAASQPNQQLVAYIVPRADPPPSPRQMREFLGAWLPDYMLPAVFITLDALPLTPNGKIDRRALPAPGEQRASESLAAPRTPLERLVAEIWENLLGVTQPGIHDNFFELGGHSLLATQVASRVRQTLGVELPLQVLFESPTIAALAEWIEQAQRAEAGAPALPLAAVRRDQPLPLSFAQQRLWALEQLYPDMPRYNIPTAVRLHGALDAGLLQQSLNALVARHEALRTTFKTADGRPYQVIAPHLEIPLQVVDLTASPQPDQVERWIEQEAGWVFDLEHGPLLRASLLRLGAEDQVFVLVMHHIVADGWAASVLVRELITLYDALHQGQPSPLPPLPIQYADFAVWQREWLQGQGLENLLAYWKAQLAGAPAGLDLPTDRPRPASPTFRSGFVSQTWPPALLRAIKKLGWQERATLFMTLLAAFQVLLYRLSGQTDIVVGTPIANRSRAELERVVGFFVNTLALRVKLDGALTFCDLLRQVREVTLGAYTHQDLPFDLLVEALQPERDLNRNPIFQVMFSLLNTPMPLLEAGGLTIQPLEARPGFAKFDLDLSAVELDGGLQINLEYNSDLIERATAERWLTHYRTLLESLVANPRQRIAEAALLTDEERQRILVEWNATESGYPDGCVHQLIEAQVSRTPQATAVIWGEQRLTYRELNQRANRLARYLQSLGVKAETLVGVCVERSADMVIGLVAILKAGGAYVPLDPTYPHERLAFMLQDSHMPVLLTQTTLQARIPPAPRVVCLDQVWEQLEGYSDENLPCDAGPANLAYVIYTSGSTGRPKGVAVTHRGVVNYLEWCRRAYPLEAGVGAPLHSSISFDLTVTALFAPLVSGRAVYLVDEALGVEALGAALSAAPAFSLIKITPAHLSLLAQQMAAAENWNAPRAFIIGGENLLFEQIAPWQGRGIMLINEYGPTETVVGCCVYQAPDDKRGQGSVPIGKPIINTQLYVLDANLQPVPPGVTGELYIGGVGLARGYLNRPDLTAEAFIPNPFSPMPGARLYRTGDLARYLPDGNLEFLGRRDHQVKLRGYRVELGEVEAVLEQHPLVRQAAAMVWTGGSASGGAISHQQLVAYVVPDQAQPLDIGELRRFLQARLPDYMIPAAFVELDALPLTPNGKLDRKALPAPDQGRLEPRAEYVAPRTPLEQALAEIWREVLGVERVGIHDNFFELGGDSLRSFQVVARAAQRGIRFASARQLFQCQTIAALAEAVATTVAVQAEQGLVAGPVALTPIQHWFLAQDLPEPQRWGQAVWMDLPGLAYPVAMEQAVRHVLRHHDALRMCYCREADGWHQENRPAETHQVFTFVDLSALPEAEQTLAMQEIAAEAQARLNLAEGPLTQVILFGLGPQRAARLWWGVHRLVIDDASWQILLDDLHQAYTQLLWGEAVTMPPKTMAYKQWAERLAAYAQTKAMQAELEGWRAALQQPVAPLPVDYRGRRGLAAWLRRDAAPLAQEGANTHASTQVATFSLNVEHTRILLRDTPVAFSADVIEILLTAVGRALARWSGQPNMLLDVEIDAREQQPFEDMDLSRTVGWFGAVFPLQLQVNTSGNLDDALQLVRREFQRVPQRGVGYGLLRYLNAETAAELATWPQPEILFCYRGLPDPEQPSVAVFEPRGKSAGQTRPRRYLLEITAAVAGDQLEFEWRYSESLHRKNTIRKLGEHVIKELQTFVAQSRSARPSVQRLAGALGKELQMALKYGRAAQTREAPKPQHTPPAAKPGANLVQIQAGGSRPPLFFVHEAGGFVFCYQDLARCLGQDYPFYALEPFGLDGSEPLVTDIPVMARRYIESIRTRQPTGPYYLGGWSFGGWVAFEMAVQLQQQGEQVAFLGLVDTLHTAEAQRRRDEAEVWANYIEWIEQEHQKKLGITLDDLRALAPNKRFEHILARMRRARIMFAQQKLTVIRSHVEATLASGQALAHYVPPQYAGPLTFFRAQELDPAEPDAELLDPDDPAGGWSRYCLQPVEVHSVPGRHAILMDMPHVRVLALKMRACLEGIQKR